MLRSFAFETVLFVLPFLAYVLWLLARARDPFDTRQWSGRSMAILVITSLVTMLVGLAVFGHFRGVPVDADYVPAHLENGKLVGPQVK